MIPDFARQHLLSLGLQSTEIYERFFESFQTVNQKINLVSFTTEDEWWSLHLCDSLMPLRLPGWSPSAQARALDVGTGGGFPGLPLLLALPGWSMFFLDSIQKKLDAVSQVAASLDLEIPLLWGRAETLAHTPRLRESFDAVFCRAVGPLNTVLELTLPFVKAGGSAVLFRGQEADAELAGATGAISKLGGASATLLPYEFFGLKNKRHLIRIEKSVQTRSEFPRRVGIPEKRPLI